MNQVTIIITCRTDLGDIVASKTQALRANNTSIIDYSFSLAHWHLHVKFKELAPST